MAITLIQKGHGMTHIQLHHFVNLLKPKKLHWSHMQDRSMLVHNTTSTASYITFQYKLKVQILEITSENMLLSTIMIHLCFTSCKNL